MPRHPSVFLRRSGGASRGSSLVGRPTSDLVEKKLGTRKNRKKEKSHYAPAQSDPSTPSPRPKPPLPLLSPPLPLLSPRWRAATLRPRPVRLTPAPATALTRPTAPHLPAPPHSAAPPARISFAARSPPCAEKAETRCAKRFLQTAPGGGAGRAHGVARLLDKLAAVAEKVETRCAEKFLYNSAKGKSGQGELYVGARLCFLETTIWSVPFLTLFFDFATSISE